MQRASLLHGLETCPTYTEVQSTEALLNKIVSKLNNQCGPVSLWESFLVLGALVSGMSVCELTNRPSTDKGTKHTHK